MTTRLQIAAIFIGGLILLGGPPCYAQTTYSQAPYITAGQFFKSLKQVSLSFTPNPTLEKYISADTQRRDIADALAQYGISIQPGMPVTLQVTIEDSIGVFQDQDNTNLHDLFIRLEFFVRAAALRDGKLHMIVASPAYGTAGYVVPENSDFQRAVFGVPTIQQSLGDFIVTCLATSLKSIAASIDSGPPWSVDALPEKEKAALDQMFATMMRSQPPAEEPPFLGLNTKPVTHLDPEVHDDRCVVDPKWQGAWDRGFQAMGWVRPPGQSPLYLVDDFFCTQNSNPITGVVQYFTIEDTIVLGEQNLVFELNGAIVRSGGELTSFHRMTHAAESQLSSTLDGFLEPDAITFMSRVVLGDRKAPSVAAAPALKPDPPGGGVATSRPATASQPAPTPRPPVQASPQPAPPPPAPQTAAVRRPTTSQPDAKSVAPVEQTYYASCAAASDPQTVYLSAMFSAPKVDYPAWQAAFMSFLKAKYGYPGYTSCNYQKSAADEQVYMQKSLTTYSAAQGNGVRRRVVQTGWMYSPPKVTIYVERF